MSDAVRPALADPAAAARSGRSCAPCSGRSRSCAAGPTCRPSSCAAAVVRVRRGRASSTRGRRGDAGRLSAVDRARASTWFGVSRAAPGWWSSSPCRPTRSPAVMLAGRSRSSASGSPSSRSATCTGDPGYPRFFAVVSLFVSSMTGLVLANNFLLLYAVWEGVGLCSYLLVGFWHEKPSAAAAARKAFLVTRLGDVGLILGIFLLWWTTGRLELRLRRALRPGRGLRRRRPAAVRGRLPAAVLRGGRQVGPVPAVRLAARRDGRPDARSPP